MILIRASTLIKEILMIACFSEERNVLSVSSTPIPSLVEKHPSKAFRSNTIRHLNDPGENVSDSSRLLLNGPWNRDFYFTL